MRSSVRNRSSGRPRDEAQPCRAQSHCGQSRMLHSPCRHERHGLDQGSGNSLQALVDISRDDVLSQVSESKSPKASQSTDLTAALSIIRANRNLEEFIRRRHVGSLRLFPQNATKPNKSADLLQKEHTSLKSDVNSEGLH